VGNPDTTVVIGWTRYPAPEALQGISQWPMSLAYVGGSDSDYFDLLERWWKSNVWNLIVVEHDIIVKPELIQELLDCPRAWCPCLYPFEQHWLFGLGCTKFTKEIRQATPWLFDEIATMTGGRHHPAKHWCALDAHMQNLLSARSGETSHPHNRQDLIEHRGTEGVDLNKWRSHADCLQP
jgi:hypothetical protein